MSISETAAPKRTRPSILGPILFIIYTTELQYFLQSHGISYHFYAGDAQIYFKIMDRNLNEIKLNRLMNEITTCMDDQSEMEIECR